MTRFVVDEGSGLWNYAGWLGWVRPICSVSGQVSSLRHLRPAVGIKP